MKQDLDTRFLPINDEKWDEKKRKNVLYSNALFRIKNRKKSKFAVTAKTIERVRNCARYLEFAVLDNNERRIRKARMCRHRFCPVCLWRRSRKLAYDNYVLLDNYIETGGRLIFLTLTVPNCGYTDLRVTIDSMNSAYARFRRRVKIKKVIKGDMKTIELTVNERTKTFHPHMHILCCVDADYFAKSNDDYISHTEFQQMWQDCLKAKEYIYVNVKAVKNTNDVAWEMSKYTAKDVDYITTDYVDDAYTDKDDVLFHLINQTKGLRFIAYTGILASIRKEMGIVDVEKQDETELLGLGNENAMKVIGVETYMWHYGFSRYLLHHYNACD